MSDAIFIGVMIVFFLLCTLYVQLCDRMIGSDELAMPAQGTDSDPDGEPATGAFLMSWQAIIQAVVLSATRTCATRRVARRGRAAASLRPPDTERATSTRPS